MPGGRHGLQNRRPDTLCRGVGSIPTLSANLRSDRRASAGSASRPSRARRFASSRRATAAQLRSVARMKPSRLRAIPSVDKVLQALGDTGLPRPIVVDVVRRELKALRAQKTIPDLGRRGRAHPRGCPRRPHVPHPAGHQRHGHSRPHQLRPGSARRRRDRRGVRASRRTTATSNTASPAAREAAARRISSTASPCSAARKPRRSSTTTPRRWC